MRYVPASNRDLEGVRLMLCFWGRLGFRCRCAWCCAARHLGVLRCCPWGPRDGHQASSECRGPRRHHAYLRWQSSKGRQHYRLKALLCRRRGGAGGRGRAARLCCIRDAASQLRPCLHRCIQFLLRCQLHCCHGGFEAPGHDGLFWHYQLKGVYCQRAYGPAGASTSALPKILCLC